MTTTLVLGAGMVGVSTALALQDRGDAVTLIDRKGIGREASYGNAGFIQTEALEPYSFPRDPRAFLRAALRLDNSVNWHFGSLAEHFAPLLAYWRHSAPARYQRAASAYSEIIAQSGSAHAPLIAAAGAENLIERRGYLAMFRSERAFDAARAEAERLTARWGVPLVALSTDALCASEPGLRYRPAGSIHYTDVWTCRSPGGLTAAYGRLFQAKGGDFAYGDAQTLIQDGAGWKVYTETGVVSAERAVVALGAWSTQVTESLGYQIPLFRKRGYHRHYRTKNGPSRPILDAERSTVMAPMEQGLRLCTGAEFTRFDAGADLSQIHRSEQAAGELFELGPAVEATPWFGHRPCMPDMLPVVGEAPNHRGLWFHFGHGHQGFTAGPATAHMLAEVMAGNTLPAVLPLTPRRFV